MTPPSDSPRALLVPLDGSAAAESVLPAAVTLAQKMPARISLLHTLERNAPAQVHGQPHLTTEPDAERYLQRIAEQLEAQGVSVSQHVHEAPVENVPRNIAAHAAEQGAELILLSTHEVSDPRSWLMGAVAQGVIRYAAPPVLLLRTGRNAPATFAPGEVIVLAAALSAHRKPALAAVDFLMDYLKTGAPFWKRETGPAGERWVEPTSEDYRARDAWTKEKE